MGAVIDAGASCNPRTGALCSHGVVDRIAVGALLAARTGLDAEPTGVAPTAVAMSRLAGVSATATGFS
jgi:hypothetical protein